MVMVIWVAVLAINSVWFSLIVFVLSVALAPRRLLLMFGLSLPLFVSLLVIHGPHGHLDVAIGLGARGTALISVIIAAAAHIKPSELAKALQGTGMSPRLIYIFGTAIHMLPMARRYANAYRETIRHQGKRGVIKYVVFPLITRMLVMSTTRELPLRNSGVLLPGRRTLLRPVPWV